MEKIQRMKNLSLAIVLLITSFAFGAAKPADYAGNWSLDMKQSKNLPPYYSNVKSHKLFIEQDEKRLKIAVEVDAERGEPDRINLTYNLDGSEVKTETGIRTQNGLIQVPTTLKAAAGEDGKLQITITREIPLPDKIFKGVTVEDWELSSDGKTLTIPRTDDTPRGKMQADMVFVKT